MKTFSLSGFGICAVLLTACGAEQGIRVQADGLTQAAPVRTGAIADTILLQKTSTSVRPGQTNAGGVDFNCSYGPGVAAGTPGIFVADCGNARILRFDNAAATGAEAIGVIGQLDLFRHDGAGITNRIDDPRLHMDAAGRLYAHDSTKVFVYVDPETAKEPDYLLQDVPSNIRYIHSISGDRLLVVGSTELAFYAPGKPERLTQWRAEVPGTVTGPTCTIKDATVVGAHMLFACAEANGYCTGSVSGSDNNCATLRIRSLLADEPTSYAAPPPDLQDTERPAYTGDTLRLTADRLLYDRALNRLFVRENEGNRILRFNGAETLLDDIRSGSGTPTSYNNASGVFGQIAVGDSNLCNQGAEDRSNAAKGTTLCIPKGMALYNGELFVADKGNHRVLKYAAGVLDLNTPPAAVILGQKDELLRTRNRLDITGSALSVEGVAVANNTLYILDTTGHRLLYYTGLSSLTANDVVNGVFGQQTSLTHDPDGFGTGAGAKNLFSPGAVAAAATKVFIADNGNQRLVADNNTDGTWDLSIGSTTTTTTGTTGLEFGAIAVSGDDLFVATSLGGTKNRIFYYDLKNRARLADALPRRVFGQALVPKANDVIEIPNATNLNGTRSADTLYDVSALAIDSEGRLWVADRGNQRILWFDDPARAATESQIAIEIDAITADGVVGQEDFLKSDTVPLMNRTQGVSGIALTSDGGLWVAEEGNARVLFFPNPMEPEEGELYPRATTVLGQPAFNSVGANNPRLSAASLSGVAGIALDSTGRNLFIADGGNYRVVHHYLNSPPLLTFKKGTDIVQQVNVELNGTLAVAVFTSDPEGDIVAPPTLLSDDSRVSIAAGQAADKSSVQLLSITSNGKDLGERFIIRVSASDNGDRPETSTAKLSVTIVSRPVDEATSTAKPELKSQLPVERGCLCSGGSSGLGLNALWLAGAAFLIRRRRKVVANR